MPRKSMGEISFAKVYSMYIQKVERKGGSGGDVDAVIAWLTGHDRDAIDRLIERDADFAAFFAAAPALNPARDRVTGSICGHRVETIADPLERDVRILDKLVDELAKGRPLAKVLRS